MAVLADRETRTQWDHITGQAIAGALAGYRLEVWPIRMTTVAAALQDYEGITIALSTYHSLQKALAQRLYPRFLYDKVWFPPFLYASMSKPIDPRLDRLAQGLGVVAGASSKYYPLQHIPMDGLDDSWDGRILHITRGSIDHVPFAAWKETGEPPMQLLSRWYGFSFTFPDCEIYHPGDPPTRS